MHVVSNTSSNDQIDQINEFNNIIDYTQIIGKS